MLNKYVTLIEEKKTKIMFSFFFNPHKTSVWLSISKIQNVIFIEQTR